MKGRSRTLLVGTVDGRRSRFLLHDAGTGRVVLIDIGTMTPDAWERFLAEATPIVESYALTP